jgi:hypothetical protein
VPYAFVVNVEFAPDSDPDDNQKMLHEGAIPAVKAQPGFQRGVWVRNLERTAGMGIAIFDTEENANAAAKEIPARRPPNAPTIVQSGVWEVAAEA